MGAVVITGANRGIGLALCEEYLMRGETVYATCRKTTPKLSETNAHVIEGVDITCEQGIKILQNALSDVSINVLINNAGLLHGDTLESLNHKEILQQFEINAVAPLLVTEALLPKLTEGAKVALITSRMGSMSDNGSGGQYGYRMSKAALNAAGVSLAQDLKPKGFAVALLHPGFVQTEMVDFNGDVAPVVAAKRLVSRIDNLTLDNSGQFWHANGESLPW